MITLQAQILVDSIHDIKDYKHIKQKYWSIIFNLQVLQTESALRVKQS